MALFHSPNVITNGLVLYLDTPNPKSTTGTTWKDISGNNIPVTIRGGTAGSGNVTNESMYMNFNPSTYNSDNSFYRINDSRIANLTTNITLETCVYIDGYKPNDPNDNFRPVSPRLGGVASPYGFSITPNRNGRLGGISQEINAGPSFTWSTSEDFNVPTRIIDFNRWIYVTQVQDDTAKTLKTYVNGVLRTSLTYTGSPNITPGSAGMDIGRGYYISTQSFPGRISFVRLYNRPFSDVEVVRNYNAMRGRFEVGNIIVDSSLKLWLDASNPNSYPGTGTTWTDLSGNGNNATLVVAPTYSTQGFFTFNGSSTYASIPSSASLTTTTPTIIIACTVASSGTPMAKGQYGSYWNYGITQLAATSFKLRNNGGDPVSATYGTISGMNIFAGVWDGTNMNFYLNGNFIGQSTTNYSPNAFNGGFLTIGCALTVGAVPTEFFNGNIAMIQVYNRPLSATEIKQNFNATRDRFGL